MATPRVFISSTCYDLYDLRNNLRDFIKNFDYEPVMSEFGDIFYDYNLHVQDACLKEIENCQMFILIIGNNYGSTYYKSKNTEKSPASVTMTEFRKAISASIARHIFINRLVKYDYDNYRKFLNEKYIEYFNKKSVSENQIEDIKKEIKNKFDSEYYFPHESYKHIFKFIDILSELNMNNAILTFETSIDIQEQLKKQWAGFMYEGLMSQLKKDSIINNKDLSDVISKIDRIDKIINNLIKEDSQNGKISLDISNIKSNIDYSKLEQYQEVFEKCTNDIIYNLNTHYEDKRRGTFNEKVTPENILLWLNTLDETLKKYAWSKNIQFENVFYTLNCSQFDGDENIPYKALLDLNLLFSGITNDQKEPFVNSLVEKFRKLEDDTAINSLEVAVSNNDDELPF